MLHSQVYSALDSFLPTDVINFTALPYVSVLTHHFNIQLGKPTVYHSYKGMYFTEEKLSDEESRIYDLDSFTDCDRLRDDRYEELHNDQDFDESDRMFNRRHSWHIGRLVTITIDKTLPDSKPLNRLAKMMFNIDFDHSVHDRNLCFHIRQNGERLNTYLGSNYYGWSGMIGASSPEEFEILKTSAFTLELIISSTGEVLDTLSLQ